MNKFLEDIRSFHRKFGLPNRKKAGFIERDYMKMRLNFLMEELTELATSCGFYFHDGLKQFVPSNKRGRVNDLEGALDALVDLQYVLLGTAYLMGMFNEKRVVMEVEEGHTTSLCPVNVTIFEEAWRRVQAANMTKVRARRKSDSKRDSTFDVVKPEGWKPPQLGELL